MKTRTKAETSKGARVRRHSNRSKPHHNEKGPVLSEQEGDLSPFGPQSLWSSLLDQREFLEMELLRGGQLLEQWRKAWAVHTHAETMEVANPIAPLGPLLLQDQVMEQFLSDWVGLLERTFATVNGRLDGQTPERARCNGDESLFALLRGAG
jgi:hypothetical protein